MFYNAFQSNLVCDHVSVPWWYVETLIIEPFLEKKHFTYKNNSLDEIENFFEARKNFDLSVKWYPWESKDR